MDKVKEKQELLKLMAKKNEGQAKADEEKDRRRRELEERKKANKPYEELKK